MRLRYSHKMWLGENRAWIALWTVLAALIVVMKQAAVIEVTWWEVTAVVVGGAWALVGVALIVYLAGQAAWEFIKLIKGDYDDDFDPHWRERSGWSK